MRQTRTVVSFGRWRRDRAAAIEEFWSWWPGVAATVADNLEKAGSEQPDASFYGDVTKRDRRALSGRMVRALTDKVSAIHPELTWELLDGILARHALVLTSEGSPELRPLTERWRRAGPGDDEFWEYYPARPPNPGALRRPITWHGVDILPQQARFGSEVDHDRGRMHIVVSHPQLPYLDDAQRLRLAFLLLDWALGEDDTERWIGEVRFSESPQELDVPGLRTALAGLAREFRGVHWAQLEGVDEQGRSAALQVRIPLPRLDYPLFDYLGTIEFLYQKPVEVADSSEMFAVSEPDTAELIELEALTRGLVALLGESAVLAASATLPDRMTLHFYACAQGVVPDQVAAWSSQQQRPVRVVWAPDPGWDTVRHFV
ncbi:MAG: hypothetical protein ACRDPW_02950 [Mycobacteriales bacterium]